MHQQSNIKEIANRLMAEMERLGYSRFTMESIRATCNRIINLHEQQGKEQYDYQIAEEHLAHLHTRAVNGEIHHREHVKRSHHIRLLCEFMTTGVVGAKRHATINPDLKDWQLLLIADISANDNWSKPTLSHILTCTRKFFGWMTRSDIGSLSELDATHMQTFLLYCSEHLSSAGLRDIKFSLKHLLSYLRECSYIVNDFAELLSFPVAVEHKIKPALSMNEACAILNAVDRSTPIGKRDYAILLLGVVSGIRSIDIVRLKLTDIDWRNGEIRIIQSKTQKALTLPLTKDVGEAIRDYMINGRPTSGVKEVFLRSCAPFRGLASKAAILTIYNAHCKKAGLLRAAHDGKSFHSLRRGVGLNMLTAGVPVTTISQYLGHSSLDSAKQYMPLDIQHLSECALSLAGIATPVKEVQ